MLARYGREENMARNPTNPAAHPIDRRTAVAMLAAAGTCAAAWPAGAAETVPPPRVETIAPDLHFFFYYAGANSVFLSTDEGILVIDTQRHPREAEDLIARIRKVSDKPFRWVINSHFHGDHTFGNAAFQKEGAKFVTQEQTARLMKLTFPKEMARRQGFFKSRNYDPNAVKLILPDITFKKEMSIWLGGREARLMYLGPGQQDGDTFVYFPHVRTLFTPGSFARRSTPNMAFTTSVDSWISLLNRVAAMDDVDRILPAHGDVATKADVKEFAAMLADVYGTVKAAIAKGVSLEEAQRTLTFPQYANWRNHGRIKDEIASLYELIKTGRRSYFE
jgi:cyclase